MLTAIALIVAPGCHLLLPDVSHQPVVHNPFPQLSRVAVAPFFNQSDDPTVDGRRFALAYFSELQAVPGFEVVPLGVVEEAIIVHQVDLSHAGETRRLARLLNVDAVVIGSITDYTPYYPPRCGLRVEWYAANPGFHEIPAGYGLPWGTPEEEFIPAPLVFEAELALAKAQFAAHAPACELPPIDPHLGDAPAAPVFPRSSPALNPAQKDNERRPEPRSEDDTHIKANDNADARIARYEEPAAEEDLPPAPRRMAEPLPALQPAPAGLADTTGPAVAGAEPASWPDRNRFIPCPHGPAQPACIPNHGPVMTHTRIYHGHDSDFTAALANYYHFRNDARFGGWQNYLQRSDDFIRFCCHVHIAEMLSARGGADQTRVVWRWADCR